MPIHGAMKVSDIVRSQPGSVQVFESHRIDHGVAGDQTVGEASRAAGVEPQRLVRDLAAAAAGVGTDIGPPAHAAEMSIGELIRFIVDRHHAYLRRAMPEVRRLSQRVAQIHGAREASLIHLAHAVGKLCDSLAVHIDRAEKDLFPGAERFSRGRPSPALLAELDAMIAEHVALAVQIRRMRCLAGDFVAPKWACGEYRALLEDLELFERDVHQHAYLEDHVLAPKITELRVD